MTNIKVLVLESAPVLALFMRDLVLDHHAGDDVDVVNQFQHALTLMQPSMSYDLIVIDVAESYREGRQLAVWLHRQPTICPTILIIPPEMSAPTLDYPFVILFAPVHLHHFMGCVARVLSKPDLALACPHIRQSAAYSLFIKRFYPWYDDPFLTQK